MPGSSQRLSASCGSWRTAASTRLTETLTITSGRCWSPWERPWSTRSTRDHTEPLSGQCYAVSLCNMLPTLHLDCWHVSQSNTDDKNNWIFCFCFGGFIYSFLDCNILNRLELGRYWSGDPTIHFCKHRGRYNVLNELSGQNVLKRNNKINQFASCVLLYNFN